MGLGCSVSSQLTDRFWQSHVVFLQPSDDVTVWVDGQQGGQMTGWVRWEGGTLWVIPYPGAGTRSHRSVLNEEMEGSGTELGDDPGSVETPKGSEPGASLQHIWQQGRPQHPGPCERERGQDIKGRDYPLPSVSSCRVQFQTLPAQEEHQKPGVSSVKGCLKLWYLSQKQKTPQRMFACILWSGWMRLQKANEL